MRRRQVLKSHTEGQLSRQIPCLGKGEKVNRRECDILVDLGRDRTVELPPDVAQPSL